MRLLHLTADRGIPLRGHKGASVHTRALLAALVRRGADVTAAAVTVDPRRPGDGDAGLALPCPVLRVPRAANGAPGGDVGALAANDRVEAALLEAAARTPFDAIYERYSLGAVAGRRAAEKLGIPWLLEVNAPLAAEASEHRALGLGALAGFVETRLWREADRLFAVSRSLGDEAVRRGADPARVIVTPNGWDPALFGPPPARRREAGAPFTVAFVGSLKPWHGLDVLSEAFVRLRERRPAARLLVIGDGPLADDLRADLSRRLPDGAWRLEGAVPHAAVPARLGGAHAAIAPYPPREDFYFSPLKVVEYAAAGLPIVASRLGQIAELLEDGRDALLVAAGDAGAMADALVALHDDPVRAAAIGRAARASVEGRSWDVVADTVLREASALAPPRAVAEVPS